MLRCVICRFPAELDDEAVPFTDGRCICLRCYTREVGEHRPMSKPLRRVIDAVLHGDGATPKPGDVSFWS